jgi:hypothetical protein
VKESEEKTNKERRTKLNQQATTTRQARLKETTKGWFDDKSIKNK